MRSRLLPVLFLGACTTAAGTAQESTGGETSANELVLVELATVGMDMASQAPVVLLREGHTGKVVPIWVGLPEAQAILRGLLGIEMPRPMTHDLLASLLGELGAELEEVAVHDLRDGTYYAELRLRMNGGTETRQVDSRPSDALALALRAGAPIRVSTALLEEPPEFDFIAPEADEQVVRVLGLTVVAPTGALKAQFSLPDRPGVVVVGSYGEAAEKGIRRGDLLVEVNGVVPRVPMDFFDAVHGSADPVSVIIWRDGEMQSFELQPTVPGVAPERQQRPAPIQT